MENDNLESTSPYFKYFYAPYLVSNSKFSHEDVENILKLARDTIIIKLIMKGISYPDCIRTLADKWNVEYQPDEPLEEVEERILRFLCCRKKV